MSTEENIAKAVGVAVGMFPKTIAALLVSKGVVVDAQAYGTDQLVDAVYVGLHSSPSFNTAFTDFLRENAAAISSV